MTRSEFYPIVEEVLEKVKVLFSQKNKSYGQDQDLFHNFRSTAKRVMQAKFDSEYEDMYRVMLIYQDKHRVALANLGLEEPEFEERCLDEIVYTLLAIALHREYEKKGVRKWVVRKTRNQSAGSRQKNWASNRGRNVPRHLVRKRKTFKLPSKNTCSGKDGSV
jgi:hypothetical protein